MGIRTYYRGILAAEINPFRRWGTKNLYTPYYFLRQQYQAGKEDFVERNLMKKVEKEFISLEELVSGGAATRLFQGSGIYEKAIKILAEKKATTLLSHPQKLDHFILSGKKIVPYVIEQLPVDQIAQALQRASKSISQRSVIELKEIGRYRRSEDFASIALSVNLELVYDERPINTSYFPYNLESLFYFGKPTSQVREINRGLAITDNMVANMSGILDALAKLKISPLDSILIGLRSLQGLGMPKVCLLRLPEYELKEIKERDHFTEKARATIQRVVSDEFKLMKIKKGDERTFKVLINRRISLDNKPIYQVQIAWEKEKESSK
jgi:hypothetical protein